MVKRYSTQVLEYSNVYTLFMYSLNTADYFLLVRIHGYPRKKEHLHL